MTQQIVAAKLHNQGATEHDPAEGMWDGAEHRPDGYWKSTKLVSIVLGGLGKVCLSTWHN